MNNVIEVTLSDGTVAAIAKDKIVMAKAYGEETGIYLAGDRPNSSGGLAITVKIPFRNFLELWKGQ